ncbi:hypothetical protein G7Z17_g10221 [Cylindrodendrum hubeiense]|uniref:Cytochrome P450 n=1 Tax=Cylindrodendrum hubeiense TaxID=595255 RepID=A0A9P5LBG2_9HYPO|nr:hypothetical protein G7Z17_g10221 [Cylindrodendrum hubeiense]
MFSTKDKENHSKRRRIIADRYANSNVMREGSLHGLQERSENFMKKCSELPDQEMDVYVWLLYEDIMREVSFGGNLAKRLLGLYSPALGMIINSGIFGKPSGAPLSEKLVLNGVKKGGVADFTLVSRLQEGKFGLGPIDIASECMDHMIAGIETTGDALCFLMWQISQPGYEKIQERLRAEFNENQGVSFEQLPYLEAVVKEGLRRFPSIPMSFPRCVPVGGRNIDGYWLPEGTVVSCQPYSMHRMDETAFPDPEAFDPERWLEEEGLAERNRLFFAFSNGGRACIGRHLATAEMKILLRDIYSKYRTLPAESMTADMSVDDQIFTSRPKDQKCLLKFVAWE